MRQRIPARKRRGCREPKFALGDETWLEWRRYKDMLLPKMTGAGRVEGVEE
jgi:hypothetical protein